MRFKWYDDIIPLSEVREIEIRENNDDWYIRMHYLDGKSYNILQCKDEQEQKELLEKINQLLMDTREHLNSVSSLPLYGWIDFTPPPIKKIELDIPKQVMSEIQETLEEENPDKLQKPDTRPNWKKFLKPNG